MTLKKWESTKKDKANDKAGAKKAGTSVAKYEKSKADAREDKAEVKKANKK